MRLHYSPLSPNSRKVRIAAALLGIDLDLVHVDLSKGEQRRREFLAKNPMGKVPVLEDGELVLPESAAIMAYLADSTPGSALYPADRRARAEVNRWLFWATGHWGPALAGLTMENVFKKLLRLGGADAAQVKRHEEMIRGLAEVLDEHLAKREWIAGPSLTIADIAVGTSLMTAAAARAPIEPFANVRAWFARILALDAWETTAPPPGVF
jgi:glutathione S-transferase